MTLAYGIALRDHATIEDAEEAAIARHSHYYTDVAGWLIRADVVRYSFTVDADRAHYGLTDGLTDGQIELWAFPVERWTRHGATMKDIWSGSRLRWVDLRPGAKQWASRTALEAIAQLDERRRRLIYVLERKLDRARDDRQIVHSLLEQKEPQ